MLYAWTNRLSACTAALVLIFLSAGTVRADQLYAFGSADSKINGSIKYSVMGRYHATFDRFQGSILYDPRQAKIKSVELIIEAATIRSRFPKLDHIVRSRRLLDTGAHPRILFQGAEIIQGPDGFIVKGVLDLHGVKRESSFQFQAQLPQAAGSVLKASGSWVINRKDFGVIWNKALDQGGVIVGNHVTVDWNIHALPEKP